MAPSHPLVTIVLPTFNGSRYLRSAIESCLRQSHECCELIIVDDASTDATPEIIAEFEDDPRVQRVRNPDNRGLPSALNSGFELARGAYCTWTSDDNLYHPDAIGRMLAFLRDHSDVDLVYCDYTIIDGDGEAVDTFRVSEPEELLRDNCVGPCFLYSRAVREATGEYAEDLRLAEDYDYWLRASVRFQLRTLHENLYSYRRHEGALSARHMSEIKRAAECALFRQLPELRWASHSACALAYLNLAVKARARGETAAACRLLGRSLGRAPWLCLLHRSRGLWCRLVLG